MRLFDLATDAADVRPGTLFPSVVPSIRRAEGCALLLPLLLALLLTACGTGTTTTDDGVESVSLTDRGDRESYTPTLDGPLRLISVSPRGARTTHRARQAITATFSQPMVPLGDAPTPPDSVLTLTPSIEGNLQWEGTQTLVFRPAEDLPAATAFEVTLHPYLEAQSGDQMEEGYTWSFETARPRLLSSSPSDGERFAPLEGALRLDFSLSVDADEAAPYIDTGVLPVDAPTNDGDSTLVLPFAETLPQDSTFTVTLVEGLPTTAGPLGMADTTTVRFRTYPPLRAEPLDQPGWRYPDDEDRFSPDDGLQFAFSTPVRFGDLREALSFDPELTWPPGVEARDAHSSTTHTITVPLEAETSYTVRIEGLTDRFGQELPLTEQRFTTRAYTPSLSIPSGAMVVESSQMRALPVRYVNVPEVRLGAERFAKEDIVPALQTYDRRHRERDARSPVAMERTWTLDPSPTQRVVRHLVLDSLLTDGHGVVGWQLGYDRDEETERTQSGLVQYTDLGLTAKFSPHQGLLLVTTLGDAEPVEGAWVEIRDEDNVVRWGGSTGADGVAPFPGWVEMLDYEDDSRPTLIAIVEYGDDMAFTSSAYDRGFRAWRFGIRSSFRPAPVTRTGTLFTDRGLYRGGETVHIKGILRSRTDRDWSAIEDSLRLVVHDPRGDLVIDEHLTSSEMGSFDTTWRIPRGAAQGTYDMRVGLASDATLLAARSWQREGITSGSFRVDAFRPAAFRVEATSMADEYVAGDFFEGQVSGRYLFGAGMPGATAFLQLRQGVGSHRPPGYDDFSFAATSGRVSETLARVDTTLNDDSQASLRTAIPGNPHGRVMSLEWLGRVTDPSQQEIAGQTRVTVHPGQFYIGVKPSTSYLDLTETDELTVDLIAVDPNGRPEADHDVSVELVRIEWDSVREVGSDGRMTWRSEEIETVIDSMTVTSAEDASRRVRFTVPGGGLYEVRAASEDVRGNAIKTDTRVYAAGSGYVAWQRQDDDRIDLVADQDTYAPGETARIMVPSPFEQTTALITVERDGILQSRVEYLTGSSPQIDIPIEEDYLPNVYVSVILLNGRTAPPQETSDPGAPAFRVGYVELPVDAGERRLTVDLTPDADTYRPGGEVTVEVQLRDHNDRGVPGEVTFSAADAGVLNLIGYRLPDPFDDFYGPRPLEVTTTETRQSLVKQRSEELTVKMEADPGGGGGEDELRTDFSPLAHWEATLPTDQRGRAELVFSLPEQLTTMRLMATAHTADHLFGRTSTDVTVTKPLVARSALPRFVHYDDRFEAQVVLTNRTDTDGTVTVTAEADSLRLLDTDPQEVSIAAGATASVSFSAHADVVADTAQVRFRATLQTADGEEEDALQVDLPMKQSTTTDVQATFASTTGTAIETLRPPEGRLAGRGALDVRLASTALTGLDGALEHLFDYPYGCIEQETSRVRPFLIGRELVEGFDLTLPFDSADEALREWAGGLRDFWTGDGFAMWPGSSTASPYVTAYVVLAMAEAQDAGLNLSERLTNDALDALEDLVRNPSDRPGFYSEEVWADTRALMLYALSRHDRGIPSALSELASNPPASPDGLSYLLRALHQMDADALVEQREPIAERLRERIRVESTQAYLTAPEDEDFGWIFASDARATAFGLSALLVHDASADFQQLAQRMIQYLMDERQQGHWTSTQDNAAVLEAFRRYVDAYEADAPDFAAEVTLAGRTLLETAFRGRTVRSEHTRVSDADLPDDALELRIAKDDGPGRLYYTARLQSETDAPVDARDQGLRIERTIERLDTSGEVVETLGADPTLPLGTLVRVTLRVQSPTDRHYVVVDDPLPAGLETVSGAFDTTDLGLLQAADTGQDRWWGSFNHTEQQDTRVLLFADFLQRGEHTYRYVARTTTAGDFLHPAAQAEQMYRPEIRGRTATGRLGVLSEE